MWRFSSTEFPWTTSLAHLTRCMSSRAPSFAHPRTAPYNRSCTGRRFVHTKKLSSALLVPIKHLPTVRGTTRQSHETTTNCTSTRPKLVAVRLQCAFHVTLPLSKRLALGTQLSANTPFALYRLYCRHGVSKPPTKRSRNIRGRR